MRWAVILVASAVIAVLAAGAAGIVAGQWGSSVAIAAGVTAFISTFLVAVGLFHQILGE
jgi:predicted alternative tryptophan synthase beta-subunit